ncbi:putative zinc ribbon protein [Citrobacter sp. C411]|uniref:putative zinc ribbon protein n=1 Tax=Citrobacter sp. C411 TaxID=3048144 RepID=UPI0039C1C158
MRILKCFLANNARNKYVIAREAAETSRTNEHWTCASCGCELLLRTDEAGEAPWFEHILHSIPHQRLMKCAWVDPEEKARAREKKLRQVVYSVDKNVRPPQEWHCVLCDTAYQGNKYCRTCKSGLYTTEPRLRDTLTMPVRFAK